MWLFLFNSFSMGVGLAMDAFSVSLVNGMNEPSMHRRKRMAIAGTFAGFQALMPMLGWCFAHTLVRIFASLQQIVHWIAFLLLLYIGGHMIFDSLQTGDGKRCPHALSARLLLTQGVATSIDALSVGFVIADYGLPAALLCSAVISGVTFLICSVGVELGRGIGARLSGRATLLGGVILIAIGLEILFTRIL